MNTLRNIAIISFSPIYLDSRVLRQIYSLSNYYNVYTVGYGPKPNHSFCHLSLPSGHNIYQKLFGFFLLFFGYHSRFYDYWFFKLTVLNYLNRFNISAFILNDSSSWPLVQSLPKDRCILDAHEFTPGELSDDLVWRLILLPFKRWCIEFLKLSSIRFCVEKNLCRFWFEYSGQPFLYLPNSSFYTPSSSLSTSFTPPYRVLHHGVAHPSRRIELMIKSIPLAGQNFLGSFVLVGQHYSYLRRLRQLASYCNSEVLEPVTQSQLISFSSAFDIALLSIYPSNVNYKYCLPNKLFQFIQSRLPIVCGPTPGIAEIVCHYQIGIVADDFSSESLAKALSSINEQSFAMMKSNLESAAEVLSWDRDQFILLEAVESLIQPIS